MFDTHETRMTEEIVVMLSRFDTVAERDGQTDRQTISTSISRVSVAVLTRDKKHRETDER